MLTVLAFGPHVLIAIITKIDNISPKRQFAYLIAFGNSGSATDAKLSS